MSRETGGWGMPWTPLGFEGKPEATPPCGGDGGGGGGRGKNKTSICFVARNPKKVLKEPHRTRLQHRLGGNDGRVEWVGRGGTSFVGGGKRFIAQTFPQTSRCCTEQSRAPYVGFIQKKTSNKNMFAQYFEPPTNQTIQFISGFNPHRVAVLI